MNRTTSIQKIMTQRRDYNDAVKLLQTIANDWEIEDWQRDQLKQIATVVSQKFIRAATSATKLVNYMEHYTIDGWCGNCKAPLNKEFNYCPACAWEPKW